MNISGKSFDRLMWIRQFVVLTFFNHADGKTLLEATELATIPSALVDRTVLSGQTDVLGSFLNRSLCTFVRRLTGKIT